MRRRASTVIAGLSSALSAAFAGLAIVVAVVLVAWGADSRSSASTAEALRTGVQVWLLAHRGTLQVPGGSMGLVPLGLSLVPAVLVLRAGTSLARVLHVDDLQGAARATVALACAYAVVAVTMTGLATTDDVSVAPVPALTGAGLMALLAGGLGVLRGAGLRRRAFRILPPHGRLVARACGVAVGTLVAAGALLAGAALAADLPRAAELSRALTPGAVSGIALLLLGVLYVPNAAIWAAAFAVGPGFAVGTGTSVSVLGVTLGPVPAMPLLAALPEGERVAPIVLPFLAAPLVAGILAGVLVARRLDTGDYGPSDPATAAKWAAVSGVFAGAAMAALAVLSGGPLGDGHLAAMGPSPWQVGLAVAVEVGGLGALTAAAMRWYATRGAGEDGE